MSDGSTKENYINNLSTLVILKCVYDRIVYIVKKVPIFFPDKGCLRGVSMLSRGGGTNALVFVCLLRYPIITNDWRNQENHGNVPNLA